MKKSLPDLQREFDLCRNYPLTFDQLTPGRRTPVIWTCVKCGHCWPATVSNRLKGTECPRCRGTIPVPGETDLATLFPHVAEEWDYSQNKKSPEQYLPFSNARVSWVCKAGHQWEEKINNRTVNGLNCPYCNGNRPISGVNDLGTLFPWLAKQWNPEENGTLKPSNVFPKSNRRVSWVCERGHTWETKIYHRTDGQGCPYCAGLKPIIGETDLETLEPLIARQWHPTKNGNHHPSEFTRFSHHEAWWVCEKGHEYPAPIYRRSKGCGCSVCNGKRIIPGVNDLASQAPYMAEEWDYTRNGSITPQKVSLHRNTPVYWKCRECGFVWSASPNNRSYGRGCPSCSHCCVDPDVNSLQTVNSILAKQWHPTKNGALTARDIAAYDNRDYYWCCENGHEWPASPANRNNGTGCPYCQGKLPVIGVNDLATICPQISAQWHPSKNVETLPEQFLPNSNKEVWWKCNEGHEWPQKINERTNGSNCPYCRKRLPVIGETDLVSLRPKLRDKWHPTKNKKGPESYFPDCSTRAWWLCEEGHSFRAPIREMVHRWHCHICEKKCASPHKA